MFGVIVFVIQVLIAGGCLWGGMKMAKIQGGFVPMLAIALICGLLGLIPYAGLIASVIIMLTLICKWTSATLWPEAVLMVVLAKGLSGLAYFCLIVLAQKLS